MQISLLHRHPRDCFVRWCWTKECPKRKSDTDRQRLVQAVEHDICMNVWKPARTFPPADGAPDLPPYNDLARCARLSCSRTRYTGCKAAAVVSALGLPLPRWRRHCPQRAHGYTQASSYYFNQSLLRWRKRLICWARRCSAMTAMADLSQSRQKQR
jgi:hypothetical protein